MQRYRIGPNFGLLPNNRARCPVFNRRADGPLNFINQTGPINYYPSEFAQQALHPSSQSTCPSCYMLSFGNMVLSCISLHAESQCPGLCLHPHRHRRQRTRTTTAWYRGSVFAQSFTPPMTSPRPVTATATLTLRGRCATFW